MAAKVVTTVQKRIPLAGIEYSSVSASCTVEAEITDLAAVPAQARALYAQAEAAVDEQLRLAPQGSSVAPVAPSSPSSHGSPNPAPTPAGPRQPTAQPYRSSGPHRGPAPVTDSQIRFLERLIRDSGTDLNAILHHHQVGSLRDLSCKAAAGLIDELKDRAAASAGR